MPPSISGRSLVHPTRPKFSSFYLAVAIQSLLHPRPHKFNLRPIKLPRALMTTLLDRPRLSLKPLTFGMHAFDVQVEGHTVEILVDEATKEVVSVACGAETAGNAEGCEG